MQGGAARFDPRLLFIFFFLLFAIYTLTTFHVVGVAQVNCGCSGDTKVTVPIPGAGARRVRAEN